MRVHFVGGVHAAGKSTLCAKLQAALKWDYAKASELLKFVRMPGEVTGKAVEDVPANQDRLIAALIRRPRESKSLLLDGHFCVLDGNQRPTPVPFETFRGIAPLSLLLVEEDATTILQRLERRGSGVYSLDLIEELLACERSQATAVAAALRLSLRIVRSDVAVGDLAIALSAAEEQNRDES